MLPSFEAFLLAVVIAGVMQVVLGFAKAGVIGDFVPGSVIKGMLAAIGLILLINQFPHLLGDDSQFETDEGAPRRGNIFSNFFYAFTNINSSAFIIGGLALLLNIVWEKFQKGKTGFIRFVPGPLLMVMLGVVMNQLFQTQNWLPALTGEHLVILPMANNPTEFFSLFTSPDWSQLGNSAVLTVAVTLALVASLETLLSIEAVDELDPYQRVTPTNRELKAQGLGNIVSGLLGGLPVTSVIVRSSANVNSGAKTKMSTIYHGTLLLLCVVFIPALLNQIPKSALAAVLIFTGYKLAKPSIFVGFYKKGWNQFLPFVGTILAILATDLLKGVLIGIGIAIIFIIRSNFKSAVVITNDADKYLVRLRKDVSFFNKAILKQGLEKVPANSYIIIDVSRADFIDQDIIEIIEDFQKHAPLENIKVEIKKNPSSISILT
jgi:MFS superfamily sulfate permease-like transporter